MLLPGEDCFKYATKFYGVTLKMPISQSDICTVDISSYGLEQFTFLTTQFLIHHIDKRIAQAIGDLKQNLRGDKIFH